MTTKERILEFIEAKGTTKSIFLKNTGLKRGFLDADKLSQAVNDKQIYAILSAYSDINIEWLVTGEGPMLKKETQKPAVSTDVVSLDRYEAKVEECVRLRMELEKVMTNN